MFTWRALPYWHNAGVQIIKKNKNTINFYKSYVNKVIKNWNFWQSSQNTWQQLLNLSEKEIIDIVNCKDNDQVFKFNKFNINFGGVSCYYMNNTFSTDTKKGYSHNSLQRYFGNYLVKG